MVAQVSTYVAYDSMLIYNLQDKHFETIHMSLALLNHHLPEKNSW